MKTYIRCKQHKNSSPNHKTIRTTTEVDKNTISNKANSTLGFLKRNLKHCPQDSRRTAYLSLVRYVEINTLWLFRYLQLAKKRTKVVSFHRLSGTGMTSLIHLSLLLKCLMTVCPSSLHSCVQGTNFSPIRTPW